MQSIIPLLAQWARLQPSFCHYEPGIGYRIADGRNAYYMPSEPSPFVLAFLQSVLQTAVSVNLDLSLTISRVAPVLSTDCWIAMISHHRVAGLTVAVDDEIPAIALLKAHIQMLEAIERRQYKLAVVSSGGGSYGGDAA